MKKKVFGRKFSRDYNSRKAMFRSLIKAFVANGFIKTTNSKAKAVQRDIDKLVTKAVKKDLNSIKAIVEKLGNDKETAKLLVTYVEKVKPKRVSGFTRIIKLPARRGDNTLMARLEWVDKVVVSDKKKSDKLKSKGNEKEAGNKEVVKKKTLKEKLKISKKKKGEQE